jgi:serine/threonine protein kinase
MLVGQRNRNYCLQTVNHLPSEITAHQREYYKNRKKKSRTSSFIIPLQIRHLLRERDILRSVEFPFIVYLLYAFKDNASLYMVMRFCPGGDLFMLLRKNKNFDEGVAKFYASQVCVASFRKFMHFKLHHII